MADPRETVIRVAAPADLPARAAALAKEGLVPAMLVATDETGGPERAFVLRWIFEPAREDRFVTLLVPLDAERPEAPSLTPAFAAASWHEREAQDLFGIRFTGHPDPRPLVVHDGWPEGLYPLRKSFDAALNPPRPAVVLEFPHLEVEGEGVFEVPVGPIHAGIIEPGHFRFSSIGEAVLNFDARLFYTHRGLEKRAEGLSCADAFFVAERLCGVCSVSHALGYAEAAEQIAGVVAPPRARVLRTIVLELERLYNHAGDMGNLCAGASYHYGTSAGLRVKETLQRLNEQVTGHRFLRGLITPGGVRQDVPPELARHIAETVRAAAVELADLMERIEANASVIDRFDDTGLLARPIALDWGVTGPAARASGIDRDGRRDHPHAAYAMLAELGVDSVRVVTETGGDVAARLLVRAGEVKETARLLEALLGKLPAGPCRVEFPKVLPPWGVGLSVVESPRGAALHWLRSDADGRIDRYHVRSASFANWPAVPFAAVTSIIPDFPLINKSFELCYSCTDR